MVGSGADEDKPAASRNRTCAAAVSGVLLAFGQALTDAERACHAISPVLPLTAVRRPHGGFWHGQLPTTLPLASFPLALNPE